jgi:hypothetical protein
MSYPFVAPEPEHVWVVLQDHGPSDGGWGPATVHADSFPWPKPLITTRDSASTHEWFETLARKLANETGKPTKLVRFKRDEVLLSIAGSS